MEGRRDTTTTIPSQTSRIFTGRAGRPRRRPGVHVEDPHRAGVVAAVGRSEQRARPPPRPRRRARPARPPQLDRTAQPGHAVPHARQRLQHLGRPWCGGQSHRLVQAVAHALGHGLPVAGGEGGHRHTYARRSRRHRRRSPWSPATSQGGVGAGGRRPGRPGDDPGVHAQAHRDHTPAGRHDHTAVAAPRRCRRGPPARRRPRRPRLPPGLLPRPADGRPGGPRPHGRPRRPEASPRGDGASPPQSLRSAHGHRGPDHRVRGLGHVEALQRRIGHPEGQVHRHGHGVEAGSHVGRRSRGPHQHPRTLPAPSVPLGRHPDAVGSPRSRRRIARSTGALIRPTGPPRSAPHVVHIDAPRDRCTLSRPRLSGHPGDTMAEASSVVHLRWPRSGRSRQA